jgi:hypothetical protein
MHGSKLCNIYSDSGKVQVHKQNWHKLGGSKVNKISAYISPFSKSYNIHFWYEIQQDYHTYDMFQVNLHGLFLRNVKKIPLFFIHNIFSGTSEVPSYIIFNPLMFTNYLSN